jgi:flagellar biosynthesis anti-sigma factor FlgM
VSNKIDGLEVRPVRVAPGAAVRKPADSAAGKAGSGAASAGEVQITSAARSLASLEQALLEMPAIDQERVDQVQQRLAGGQYEVDPGRVARGLMRLENDLLGLARK